MNAVGEQTRSIWMDVQVAPDARKLTGKMTCDVAIVGGGIAGLSIAYELTVAGRAVVVLDRGQVGGGMIARTTAHLAPVCDDGLDALLKRRGLAMATLFQRSHEAAVSRIEANVRALGIDCDFRRLDSFLFPAVGAPKRRSSALIDAEYAAARAMDIAVKRVPGLPLKGFAKTPSLCFADHATFHPLKYLRGLAAAIRGRGGRIFADSAVVDIAERRGGVRVTTADGAVVSARHAVIATNAPVGNARAVNAKMVAYRTYAVAFALPQGALPNALYCDMEEPYHYVGLHPAGDGSDILIAGGSDHRSGATHDGAARFDAIETWSRRLVPALGKTLHRWSGQVMEPFDYSGFIGRLPARASTFVVAGDSGQGMTNGALAGLLIKDLIVDGDSPWAAAFAPGRRPQAGDQGFARKGAPGGPAKRRPATLKALAKLAPGDGRIVSDGGREIAACRDLGGTLHLHRAASTYGGATVGWNATEQCWDCAGDGSQFAPDGAVLAGPATRSLKPARVA